MTEEEFLRRRREVHLEALVTRAAHEAARVEKLRAEARQVDEQARRLEHENRFSRKWDGKLRALVLSAAVAIVPTVWTVWNHFVSKPLDELRKETADFAARQVADAKEKIAEKERRVQELASQADAEQRRATTQAGLAKAHQEQSEKAQQRTEDLEKRARSAESAKSLADRMLGDAQKRVAEAETKIAHAEKRAQTADENYRDAGKKLEGLQQELGRKNAELAALNTRVEELGRQLAEAQRNFESKAAAEQRSLAPDFKPIAQDPMRAARELESAEKREGFEGRLAKSVMAAGIRRGFFTADSEALKAKLPNTTAEIARQRLTVEGRAIGLFDLTVFGSARQAILITTENAYFYLEESREYRSMKTSDLARSSAERSGLFKASIKGPGGTVGPIVFAGSDVSADQFVSFVNAFGRPLSVALAAEPLETVVALNGDR